jgi:hypothetical protein
MDPGQSRPCIKCSTDGSDAYESVLACWIRLVPVFLTEFRVELKLWGSIITVWENKKKGIPVKSSFLVAVIVFEWLRI